MDMRLSLLCSTGERFGETYDRVSDSQVPIQSQRAFALCDRSLRAVGVGEDDRDGEVGESVIRGQRERFGGGRLSAREALGPVIGDKTGDNVRIRERNADQRIDAMLIKRQSAFEKTARL